MVGLVEGDEEVSGSHAALGGQLGNQEEVIALVSIAVLNKTQVYDCAWLWVQHLLVVVLDEHSLVDPLVDHDKSDQRWVHVVESILEDGLELGDLSVDDLLAHLVADTIAVDDDFLRIGADILMEFI